MTDIIFQPKPIHKEKRMNCDYLNKLCPENCQHYSLYKKWYNDSMVEVDCDYYCYEKLYAQKTTLCCTVDQLSEKSSDNR